MSFSGTVKKELLNRTGQARHCRIAELAAFLLALGRAEKMPDGSFSILIQTENESVLRKCFTLLKKTFNIESGISIHESSPQKKNPVYSVTVSRPSDVSEIFETCKLVVDNKTGGALFLNNSLVIQQNCCKRAFIRGAFLASGSVSDPKKSYHFEIVCADCRKAGQLQEVIRSFHIDAKTVPRKKSYVVYVKEGAQIVDMLAIMEANVALMDLENIRILKEMRNSVNRQVNCETANINKTVNAAVKQVEDIRLVEQRIGFDHLSEGLEEIARMRLQYPEATLKELGMMLSPQVGKSGVNHRLRKLSALAEELRENKEESL